MSAFPSRALRLLIALFWILLVLSVPAAIFMAIPQTAVYIRIFLLASGAYLGFWTPFGLVLAWFSLVMANLWWVLLLAVPFVLMLRSRPLVGLVISAVASAAVLLIPPQIIRFQSNRMLAQARGEVQAAQTVGPINSVTVVADGCDALCERLLLGGMVTTVRVTAPKNDTLPKLMFRRAQARDCRALDPAFPADTPCLLARPDDGMPSDVVIERHREGDGQPKREKFGFSPVLLLREQITLRRPTSDETVAAQTHLLWAEPQGYLPLQPNTGFDGRGIHGGGLIPRQRKRQDAALDPAELLRAAVVAIAEPRAEVIMIKAKGRFSRAKGYPEPAAYDLALIRSMLNTGGLGSETGGRYVQHWASRFAQNKIVPDTRERELINEIYATQRPIPREISLLIQRSPEYLVGGLDQLYVNIRSDDRTLRLDAVLGISRAALNQTPEQNEPQAKAYLALLEDRINLGQRKVELAGRFTFDPVPVLRHYLEGTEQKDKNSAFMFVFDAVCRADPRWAERLAPVVIETVHALQKTQLARNPYAAYRKALDALNYQQQRTAWDSLRAELGPDAVAAARAAPYGVKQCR